MSTPYILPLLTLLWPFQMQAPDVYKHAGLTPQKSAETMTVPPGFSVKLFAGEPDVHQPIAFCIDDRGRLWVVEAYCYPTRRAGKGPFVDAKGTGDKILIFEDTDGDGKFDKKTVFIEDLNLVSGIELGFGGVWVGAAPYLMFIPIKDGEDKPAGPPQILLDGWGYQDTHETLNTFTWGPDGWLYGCHGVFTHSKIGKPGTPDKERIPMNAGVWRYHPTRHVFEVFAHGTSNPWGLDFDQHGQAFVEACVIPHNWHIIQGGRYHRQGGQHFNPHTYADIQTIAEHRHFVGADPWAGSKSSDSIGGGHAHCGTMIYQGGTWPKEYHGLMFMGNIHGHRLNVDRLTPKGSGYVATREPDFLLANDAWARFINMQYGPDGNVYLIDWYDKQACHDGNVMKWDRSNGRIYKICHKDAKAVVGVDLGKKTRAELIELQTHSNAWYARHALRLLQERTKKYTLDEVQDLSQIILRILDGGTEVHRLRALAAYNICFEEALSKSTTGDIFGPMGSTDPNPYVRGWAMQFALDVNKNTRVRFPSDLAKLAKVDPSPVVRLYVSSALQRLPLEQRWDTLTALLAHAEDATDHNLPLMYWYAAEPLAEKEPAKALDLAFASKVPPIPRFMARRVSSTGTPENVGLVTDRLANANDETLQLAILRGLQDGLKGRQKLAMPASWPNAFAALSTSKNAEIRQVVTALAVTFGDTKAFAALREILAKPQAAVAEREQALAALVAARDKELIPMLHKLLTDPQLRGPALRGLAVYDDPKTPQAVLAVYASLSAAEKRDALNTLASRAAYGKAMLDAVADKRIAANEISPDLVRQLRNLNDKSLNARIAEVWGIVRATPAERAKEIADWKKYLGTPGKTDLSVGRGLYAKTCQQCHGLFGVGGNVGPDITGANRGSIDYLLENILDPSAVIPKEYTSTVIDLKNGRVVTGIVRSETAAALTVLTANEALTIPRDEIDKLTPSDVSMMPDDLLKGLTKDEVRSLIAYLQSPKQVPLKATPENAKDFFNGKDLTGWDGDPKLWKVENGEIVGRSTGLKRNEFLRSNLTAGDFKLSLKVKLVPNSGNSGVQFHSEPFKGNEMKGPQADIGASYWGTLYEENMRGTLWKQNGDKHVKVNDWNEYVIEVKGTKVRTWLNGQLCVDLDDPKMPREGIFALQLHSGGAMEVRFKELRLEVGDKKAKAQHKVDDGWTTEFAEDKKDLMHTGRNPYFILEPGHFLVLEAGDERVIKKVLHETKMVDGVETRVLEEREWKAGNLIEVSRNYYVISKRTNSVYYFGEDVDIYKNGKITGHDGSWLSGVKGAKFGLMMPGTPLLKGRYHQEVAPGDAMDRAEIVSMTETVVTKAGTFKNCLKTIETSVLEPGTSGHKIYAPGIGCVDDGSLKLVEHGFEKKPK